MEKTGSISVGTTFCENCSAKSQVLVGGIAYCLPCARALTGQGNDSRFTVKSASLVGYGQFGSKAILPLKSVGPNLEPQHTEKPV